MSGAPLFVGFLVFTLGSFFAFRHQAVNQPEGKPAARLRALRESLGSILLVGFALVPAGFALVIAETNNIEAYVGAIGGLYFLGVVCGVLGSAALAAYFFT